MILSKDQFWDVRARERHEEQTLRNRIAIKDQEIAMARRAMALHSSEGFADFLKAVSALQDRVRRELSGTLASNDYMRVLQGKVQALENVLQLLEHSESALQQLAEQRDDLQNQLTTALQRRPSVREDKA